MDTTACAIEYTKVLLCYSFLMFVWPKIMFRRHLSGRSRIYQFGFCATGQLVLIATIVLSMGVVHVLNHWMIWLFFYGLPLGKGVRYILLRRERLRQVARAMITNGKKTLTGQAIRLVRQKLAGVLPFIRKDFWECLAIAIMAIYGMIYFSWASFQCPTYGFGDLYTHHSWINGLIQGKAFSEGVYPEALHCLVYVMHTLFALDTYSIMLFLGGIHIAVTLVSAYLLLRELFGWRYTALFVLTLFLTLNVYSVNGISAFSRLQYALPQEFGMAAQLLCALFFLRYLKSTRYGVEKGWLAKYCVNQELFAFTAALTSTIATHFYSTIMAFFMCAAIAIFYMWQIFTLKRLIPLLASVLCALIVACTPMAVTLASGTPFQGSIGWALSVIEGTDNTPTLETKLEGNGEESSETDQNESSLKDQIEYKLRMFYKKAYLELYGESRSRQLIILTVFALLAGIILRILLFFLPPHLKTSLAKAGLSTNTAKAYLSLTLGSVLYMALYAARAIGLPALVSDVRLCATEQLLILAVACIPLDIIFALLAIFTHRAVLCTLSYSCTAAIIAATVMSGNYHGYLYIEYSRYNAEAAVTESIKNSFPPQTYTLVSPTEVLYGSEGKAWHEELLRFVLKARSEHYTLPSEYVFLYVEKRPLVHSQIHFVQGPSWLAGKGYYSKICQTTNIASSQEPDVVNWEIDDKYVNADLSDLPLPFKAYTTIENRTAIATQAYSWCQEFARLYPSEMNVYYEDTNFVCYCFRQEPYAPYELGLSRERR